MHNLTKVSVRFLIFFPIAFLLGIVLFYAEPLFLSDDFHLLEKIIVLQKPEPFLYKLKMLIEQHNEHRILFPRLITWFDYQLEGHINWPTLMILGNLIWCGILYFLWTAFRVLKLSLWYFLPVPWLLFHPSYYDNLTWAISVLQQSVIVFLLSWLVYAFTKRRYLLAILIIFIATFTHGNGIFGIGIGVVFLVLDRNWRWLSLWLFVSVCLGIIYFYDFAGGQNANFGHSFANPLQMTAYFSAFLGSITMIFFSNPWTAVLWGALILGGIVWFGLPKIYSLYFSDRPLSDFEKMVLGNLLFIVITALLVAVSRSWMSPDLQIPPRYAHYSPYLTCWFYLVSLSLIPRTIISPWAAVWTAGATLLCLLSYLNYFTKLEYRRDSLRADATNWNNYSVFLQYIPDFNRNIRPFYQEALQMGICANPPSMSAQFPIQSRDTSLRFTFRQFDHIILDGSGEHPNTMLVMNLDHYQGPTPFLVLLPNSGQPVWIPFYRSRNGYKKILSGQSLRKDELMAEVFLRNLPVGTFKLGIYSEKRLTLNDQQIEVRPDHTVKIF